MVCLSPTGGICCLADISSVSPSLEQAVLSGCQRIFFSPLIKILIRSSYLQVFLFRVLHSPLIKDIQQCLGDF